MVTKTMEERIVDAALLTWDAIGDDWLSLYDGGPIGTNEVREGVTDAGRLKAFGRDEEAATLFYGMSLEEQDRLLEKAFPSTRLYGY